MPIFSLIKIIIQIQAISKDIQIDRSCLQTVDYISKKLTFSLYSYKRKGTVKMTETIKGYQFDITAKVYLNSPKNKFWEVTMNKGEVNYRAGVLRNDEEHKIIEVDKNYESETLAKATVITKIAAKIEKGYFSKTAAKIERDSSENKTKKTIKRRKKDEEIQETRDQKYQQQKSEYIKQIRSKDRSQPIPLRDADKKLWKGWQKGDEIVQMHLIGNQLKVIKRLGEEESSQIQNYKSYIAAVNYVHAEEEWYRREGFKPMVTSNYTEQETKTTRKKDTVQVPNLLGGDRSLTNMTDNAMWQNSALNNDGDGENIYVPNPFLGPPIDHCIKCLLAQNYRQNNDPKDWIMSQKLDGVRCLWTGTDMFSRNGNKFNFPNFFTKNWPRSQLDGELFIGRGKFSQTLSAVKKNIPISTEWQNLKYLVFDAPGLAQPFKKRIDILHQQLGKVDNPFLKCHAHRPCLGFPDLFTQLDKVNKVGGQGIMLRQPNALYENKRSKNLQKVKTFHDDEAQIIGYTAGTGRCTGWVGSLRVRNAKGIEFQVGSGLNDQLRQNPPSIGSKITFKYQQINKQSGKPRFPTFLRIYQSA